MSTDSDRTIFDDAQSNIPATNQGVTHNVLEFRKPREEAPNSFFHTLQGMCNAYMRADVGARQQLPYRP